MQISSNILQPETLDFNILYVLINGKNVLKSDKETLNVERFVVNSIYYNFLANYNCL